MARSTFGAFLSHCKADAEGVARTLKDYLKKELGRQVTHLAISRLGQAPAAALLSPHIHCSPPRRRCSQRFRHVTRRCAPTVGRSSSIRTT